MKKLLLLVLLVFSQYGYSQMSTGLSEAEKIYGLSKFWQEVNYNFIYYNKVDKAAWDELYKEMLIEVQATPNDYEYFRLLQKFCAYLKDGHTNVYFPKEIQEHINFTDFGDYRFLVSNIDGKAIITGINLSKKEEIPLGTEIVKVNGLDTRQYLEEFVLPYISSSTTHVLEDWGVRRMFEAPIGTSFELELNLPDGNSKFLKITAGKSTEAEVYPPIVERELLEFKWLNSELAYVALNSFADEEIINLFTKQLPELYKAKKLIVDLRYNGGGNTSIGREIFKYLTNDTLLYGSKAQSRLHIPAHKAWGKFTAAKDTVDNQRARNWYLSHRDEVYHDFPYQADTVKVEGERLVVPTVLLIGHNTASAAEDFLIYADNQQHMTRIGAPSFGSTGQPLMFDLPGGGFARICTKKDTYPDGKEFVGVGVQPDIAVSKTLADYLENRDPELTKAMEFLKAQ